MKRLLTVDKRVTRIVACAIFSISAAVAQTSGITVFGALSNFDIYNDTGQDAYGFQIELDGVSPQQVIATFPATRYGAASIIPFAGGVYVRYNAQYDPTSGKYSASTSVPAAFTPTGGHSCVMTFIPGCDHYGIVVANPPTNTVMNWLVADPNVA